MLVVIIICTLRTQISVVSVATLITIVVLTSVTCKRSLILVAVSPTKILAITAGEVEKGIGCNTEPRLHVKDG